MRIILYVSYSLGATFLNRHGINSNPYFYLTSVETCICYVGQELDRASGKRYGWSLPEQTLCECTEFRLGGVNMKPQVQPNEIERGMESPTHAPGLRGKLFCGRLLGCFVNAS